MFAHDDLAIQRSKLEDPLFAEQVASVCVRLVAHVCLLFLHVFHNNNSFRVHQRAG